VDRFQARFRPDSGACSLVRIRQGKEEVLAQQPTGLKQPGTYHLRFANVDERLTLWVDESLPFGDGHPYDLPQDSKTGEILRGPSPENDLGPAGIGVRGAGVSVHKLKLWRDTYYTYYRPPGFGAPPGHQAPGFYPEDLWGDPSKWREFKLNELPAMTLYVQPGHYFVLGDNSPQSSDSRSWGPRGGNFDALGGLVPGSDLLGPVLLVYYPFDRAGPVK
jgi:signal peptidase I